MGKHSAPEEQRRNSLVDTTLTTLRKIMHLEPREETDREPAKRIRQDTTTVELSRVDYEPLPDYGRDGVPYENWDYLVKGANGKEYSGWYAISPTSKGMEDAVAASILADWFDYNQVPYERRRFYEISVRRPGAAQWQGFAEGRE